jgi:hypothetical protein
MATRVEQAQLTSGATRNKPITAKLERILDAAARAAGVDRVVVGSGGQPAAPGTPRKGSTRHDNGRAADFKLYQGGKVLTFTDAAAPPAVVRFITECARLGANGIGASVKYMGPETFHVGFGLSPSDHAHVVWGGAKATSAGAPAWLREACAVGWSGAPVPRPRPAPPPVAPTTPSPPPPDVEPAPEAPQPATGFLAVFFAFLRRIFGGS